MNFIKINLKIYLFLIILGCGKLSKYNISNQESQELSLDSLDLGVEILCVELQNAGLIEDRLCKEMIYNSFLLIKKESIPFICGNILAVSCLEGTTIRLGFYPEYKNCIAKTGYLHELTHLILCYYGSCDPDHLNIEWWTIADGLGYSVYRNVECP